MRSHLSETLRLVTVDLHMTAAPRGVLSAYRPDNAHSTIEIDWDRAVTWAYAHGLGPRGR